MTTPEVDQELERLFAVARAATAPSADARGRIRAGLAPRLVAAASAVPLAAAHRAWFGLGVAVVGVGALAFWLSRAPQPKDVNAPALGPALVAPPAASALEPAPLVAPPASAAAPSASAAAAAASVAPPPPAPAHTAATALPASDPAEELALVRAMQQALRSGNPSQALTLAADHARRFPHGGLVEEREGVRAVAQCQLAPPGARDALLAAFTRRFAASPYAGRVKAACQ